MARFSESEKAYFAAAAVEGRVSQTHFVNPDAEMCYRCPICDKTLNPGGIAKNATRHFLRLRNIPHREYVIRLSETNMKTITIHTTDIATQRAGAEPPQSQTKLDAEEKRSVEEKEQGKQQQKKARKKKTGQKTYKKREEK